MGIGFEDAVANKAEMASEHWPCIAQIVLPGMICSISGLENPQGSAHLEAQWTKLYLQEQGRTLNVEEPLFRTVLLEIKANLLDASEVEVAGILG